jgi:hypothetical protein
MTEEILPALDKLRREKASYMEWQAALRAVESLQRFCVAFKYWEAARWVMSVVRTFYAGKRGRLLLTNGGCAAMLARHVLAQQVAYRCIDRRG